MIDRVGNYSVMIMYFSVVTEHCHNSGDSRECVIIIVYYTLRLYFLYLSLLANRSI
jgi:hypothetical protein